MASSRRAVRLASAKKLSSARRAFSGDVDYAAFDAIAQGARGEIDEHDFVGFVHHPIGHGFAHADAGDVPDLVVEAFQVLHVHVW